MTKKFLATILDSLMLHKWPYWVSAFTVGIVAVFYAKLVFYAEQLATYIANIDNYYLLILSPVCFAGSWALVHFFAPEAKGSGIPQVMVAIDEIKKCLNFKCFNIKAKNITATALKNALKKL